jgi:pimeloyl-ACP methyl ester carboxylesterase
MQPQFQNLDIPSTESAAAHRMAYYAWGSPNNPAIFCVHGLTRNARDFDYLARELAGQYYVICPDMAGRGKSPPLSDPKSYHYGTYVADVLFLLQSLSLSQIRWVGTSMGGIIGMMLMNTAPGIIQSLVLNDIGCTVSAAGLKRISEYAGAHTVFQTTDAARSALRSNLSTFGIADEAHWEHMFEHSLVDAQDGSVRLAYDPSIMFNFPKDQDIKDIDLWGLWEGVKTKPLLMIRGKTSDLLTLETVHKMQASHTQNQYHEVENAGHAPCLMDTTTISLIKNWLI